MTLSIAGPARPKIGPLRATAVESIQRHNLRCVYVLPDKTDLFPNPIGEAAPYAVAGIPVVQLISGPEYLFTSDDTLDKVAGAQLVPTVDTFIDLIEYVDKA